MNIKADYNQGIADYGNNGQTLCEARTDLNQNREVKKKENKYYLKITNTVFLAISLWLKYDYCRAC